MATSPTKKTPAYRAVSVRLTPSAWARVQREAARDNRSVSRQVETLLLEALAARNRVAA